jgi:hypothetical protein
MLTFAVLMLVVAVVAGAPARRRNDMLKAMFIVGLVVAVIVHPEMLVNAALAVGVLAAVALGLAILHLVVRSHDAHVHVLEQNRKSGPLAYIRWLLVP